MQKAVASQTPTAPAPLPRVLYAAVLVPGDKFGSLEEQLLLTQAAFAAEGGTFMPLFICDPAAARAEMLRERGLAFEMLDLRQFRSAALGRLRSIVARHRADIVQWSFTPQIGNPYLWALSATNPRLRHWFTDHVSRISPDVRRETGLRRFLKRGLLRRYGKVVAISDYVHDCLDRQGIWDNVVTQYHFINTDRFAPAPAIRAAERHRRGVDDRFVVLYAGQLIADKGVDVAVDALAMVPEKAVLWIAGAGNAEADLRARAARLGLDERVAFLGQVADVSPLMQAADVFVCPSRWGEAAGLVNIEAQASGRTVLSSRVGGIPEYVREGVTGELFPVGDASSLGAAIAALMADPERLSVMSASARTWVASQFSAQSRLPEVLDLYRQWR